MTEEEVPKGTYRTMVRVGHFWILDYVGSGQEIGEQVNLLSGPFLSDGEGRKLVLDIHS